MALEKRISRRGLFALSLALGAAVVAGGGRGKAAESRFAASRLTPGSGHTGAPGCQCPMCKAQTPVQTRMA